MARRPWPRSPRLAGLVAEAERAAAATELLRRDVDERLAQAARLFAQGAAEYAAAVAVLRQVAAATDLDQARAAAIAYLREIG